MTCPQKEKVLLEATSFLKQMKCPRAQELSGSEQIQNIVLFLDALKCPRSKELAQKLKPFQ